jgi:predicted nuclease of restriction endonuclease-like RecB superfamily
MLTRELAIAEYDSGQIKPDRLTRVQHAQYLQLAESMLEVYRNGTGRMRHQIHANVHSLFVDELDCPARRIDAFCKLLDEKATYDKDKRGNAAALRQKVFRTAACRHPLVQSSDQLFESSELTVKTEIANELGKSWSQIERELFSDVVQFHRLKSFEGYETAQALLARYNVAQTQAVLYDAVSMVVWACEDFKLILRYAKLARLMHTIERKPDGTYLIKFDGPISVLKQSRRYGVAFAKFLPALLSCSGWKMTAIIQHRRSSWQNQFCLTPKDGLTSNVKSAELFDSCLEENFAAKWGDEPREGWRLFREGEVLFKNQKVFVPDFLFIHDSGQRALLEIVGFWTPEYLESKQNTISTFSDHQVLLAVSDSIEWGDTNDPEMVFKYKTVIKVSEVLERLIKLREAAAR